MARSVNVRASIGATTDREVVIAICATNHVQRIALLYPGRYEPSYHVDVFEDIGELFFITLTTNCRDILSKDSRAVGISNAETPFTAAEAKEIVSRTTFVSKFHRVWEVEVKSITHAGTLVEATAGDEDDILDDHDGLPSTSPNTDEQEGYFTSLMDQEQGHEDKLEEEYQHIKAAKEGFACDEKAQIAKTVEIMKLKKCLASKEAELRRAETTTLPRKREAIRSMDQEYYSKLKKHEDLKVAMKKQANGTLLAGL